MKPSETTFSGDIAGDIAGARIIILGKHNEMSVLLCIAHLHSSVTRRQFINRQNVMLHAKREKESFPLSLFGIDIFP